MKAGPKREVHADGKTSMAAALGAYGQYSDGVESAEVVVVRSDPPVATLSPPDPSPGGDW